MQRREFLTILSAGAVGTCLPSIPLLSSPDIPAIDDVRRDGDNIYVYARVAGPVRAGEFVEWVNPTTVRRVTAHSNHSRISLAGDGDRQGRWIHIYGSAIVPIREREG